MEEEIERRATGNIRRRESIELSLLASRFDTNFYFYWSFLQRESNRQRISKFCLETIKCILGRENADEGYKSRGKTRGKALEKRRGQEKTKSWGTRVRSVFNRLGQRNGRKRKVKRSEKNR